MKFTKNGLKIVEFLRMPGDWHWHLKVFSYGKFKLLDEYFLESIQVVLLVKDEHCLLVINRIYRTKTKWTIAIGYQNGIAGDAGCALVAIYR